MGNLKFNYSVVVPNGGVPVISETEYYPDANALDFYRTRNGTYHWAIYWKDDGDPVLNENGTWTGPVIESGQTTIPEGEVSFSINYATEVGNRLAYGIIDGAGRVSNIVYEDVVISDLATIPVFVGEGPSVSGIASLSSSWPAGHQAGDMAIAVLGIRGTDAGASAPAGWVKRGRYQAGTSSNHASIEIFTRTATSNAEAPVTFPDGWNFGLLALQVYRPVQGGTINIRNLGGRSDTENVSGGTGTTASITGGTTTAVRGRLFVVLRDIYDDNFPSHGGLLNREISAFRERKYFGSNQATGGWLTVYDGAFQNGPDTITAITANFVSSVGWAGVIFEIYEA